MLHFLQVAYAAELITSDIVQEINKQYPSVSHIFDAPLRRVRDVRGAEWDSMHSRDARDVPGANWDFIHLPGRVDNHDTMFSETFNEAIQLALESARSKDPDRFETLASKAFGDGVPSLRVPA